jgi:L-amino acid N-acyltransferase YncA
MTTGHWNRAKIKRMAISVRSGNEQDAELASKLMNSYIEDGRYTALTEMQSTEKMLKTIRYLAEHGTFTVAMNADSLAGMQMVFPFGSIPAFQHVGDIGTYVDPNAHRLGVGRAMANFTFERAKDTGFSKLIAMIRADNHRALEFYKSVGFEYIGLAKKQACVRGVFIDEIFMERLLIG